MNESRLKNKKRRIHRAVLAQRIMGPMRYATPSRRLCVSTLPTTLPLIQMYGLLFNISWTSYRTILVLQNSQPFMSTVILDDLSKYWQRYHRECTASELSEQSTEF